MDVEKGCIWFEDGNVVLIADGKIAFRVYKGLLSLVSPVFSNMFVDGKPQATFEDCPVVNTSDSPSDWRHFLQVVVCPGTKFLKQDSIAFSTLASVIRMAHKYEAVEILDAATSRLENFLVPRKGHWIDTDTPWDDRWDLGQRQYGVSFEYKDAIEAINIAHLIEKPLMLPVAYYLVCLSEDIVCLRTGVPREDGTTESLTDEDFTRCILARGMLTRECDLIARRAFEDDFVHALRDNSPWVRGGKCGSVACKEVVQRLYLALKDDVICLPSNLLVPVMRRKSVPAAWTQYWQSLCRSCQDRLEKRSVAECMAVRKKLPTFFGLTLEGWE